MLPRFGKAPLGEPAMPGAGLLTLGLGVVLPSTEVPSGSWLVPAVEPHGRPSASVRPTTFSVPDVEGLAWSVPGGGGLPPKVLGGTGLVSPVPGADGLAPNAPDVDGLVGTVPGADGLPPNVPEVEGLVWTVPGTDGLVPKVPGADGGRLPGEVAVPEALMPDEPPLMPDDALAPPPVLPAPAPLWPSASPGLPARRTAASMDKDCRICGIAGSCVHLLPGNRAGHAMFREPWPWSGDGGPCDKASGTGAFGNDSPR